MGIFSSSKNRSETSNTSYNIANYNTGSTGADGGGPQNFNVAGNSAAVNIATSDFGAIQAGLKLGQQSLSSVQSLAQGVVNKTLDIAAKNQVSETAQAQGAIVKVVALLVIAGLAYAVLKGRG
ncbi:MAG: hypothetical protein NVS9B2_27930 [Steroidobacteraceae bacterium]